MDGYSEDGSVKLIAPMSMDVLSMHESGELIAPASVDVLSMDESSPHQCSWTSSSSLIPRAKRTMFVCASDAVQYMA
ncbi:hypothetical protein ACP70R_044229 [Stipagrostis hirtigluma subsp. patula]